MVGRADAVRGRVRGRGTEVIFGMLGVHVTPDGKITVNPNAPGFSSSLKLTGLHLRGRCLDIAVEGDQFTVTVGG